MADRIKGITVEIGGDTTKLSSALRDVNKTITESQKDLKDLNKALKLDPKNVELLKQKQEILNREIGATEEKLDTLKTAQEQAAAEMANGSEEAKRSYELLTREISTCQAQLNNLQTQAEQTDSDLENIDKVDYSSLSDKLDKVSDKVSAIGDVALGVSAGIAAMGAAALESFNDVDSGADIVIKKTGATGDAAEKLKEIYEQVATSVVTTFDQAGAAVGEINTRFGYTGQRLESLSEEFLKFSHITDQDVTAAISGVDKAMKTFNVDSSETKNVLGLLASTAQQTGIDVGTLESQLQTNGAALQEMGLGLGESVQLMGALEQSGADVSSVISGMKKAAANYLKEGKDMNAGLSDLISRLQNADTQAEATQEAFEVFGSKAGLSFVNLAKQGKINLDELGVNLDDYKKVVNNTYDATLSSSDSLSMTGNNAKLAMSKLGESLDKMLIPVLEKLNKVIDKVATWLDSLSDEEKENIVNIGGIALGIGVVAKLIPKIIGLVKGIAAVVNPVTATIAVGIGLIAGFIALTEPAVRAIEDAAEAEAGWDENAKALRDHLDEVVVKLDETAEKQRERAEAVEEELKPTETLWSELQKITDENGNIKKGYEERAKVITGALAEALGTEITIVDGQILKYDELKKSVDEAIQAKRLGLLLDSSEEAYLEALTEIDGKQKTATESAMAYQEAVNKLNSIMPEYQELQKQWEEGTLPLELRDRYLDLNTQVLELGSAISNLKGNYDDALREFGQYQMTLDKYDQAMTAATNGSVEEMEEAAKGMTDMMKGTEEDFRNYGLDVINDTTATVLGVGQTIENNGAVLSDAMNRVLGPVNQAIDETFAKLLRLGNYNGGNLNANVNVTNNNTLTLDGQVVARSVNKTLGGIVP